MTKSIKKWIPPLIMALVLIGCATAKEDWEKAQTNNTIQAYQEFVTKHPSSEWTDIARQKIETADWEKTKNLNIFQKYQEFLAKYPSSEFTDIAKQKIERFEWGKTEKANTIQAYQEFLIKYPSGEFADNAKQKIEEIDWEETKNLNTMQAYKEFLTKYPSGDFAAIAIQKIEVPQQIIEKIPHVLVYEKSDVLICYELSGELIELVYKDGYWRFVMSEVGDKIEPGKIMIIGKAKAGTKLLDSRKGNGVIRGSLKYDKKGIPCAGKDGAMLNIREELK